MASSVAVAAGGPVTVLHVDDEPGFAEVTAELLEEENERFSVVTATSATGGLDRLAETDVDCVVSDYDMPGMNGIEFLRACRTDHGDLPFILFTGEGSEAVASDAFSAGATDYLQKQPATDQYELLASRIENAIERHAIERERRQWKQAVETADEGIAIVDDDGQFVQVNEAYADVYDESPDALVGRHWRRWYPADEVERFEGTILPTLEREGSWEGEATGRRADGTQFTQHLSLSLLDDGGHVCVLEDVTERKEREEELRWFKTVIEAIEDAVYVIDQDGVLRYVNESYARMKGTDRETVIGTGIEQWADQHVIDRIRRLVAEMEHEDRDIGRLEYDFRTVDGDRFPVELRFTHVEFPGGERGRVGVIRDVSERKERERELRRQNERLDEFASLVSHDLRNPLNVLMSSVELAAEEGDPEHFERCRRAADRMDRLIGDLLQLARQGDAVETTGPVSLATVAERSWDTVDTGAATLDVAADRTVVAEEGRLMQLLENLFRNAVEHGGHAVTVTVGDIDDGFYVADDGSGVPPTERDRVFEAGYSTAEDGTGFGLTIVQRVVDAHGWSVRLAESDDGGARFEVTGVDTGGSENEG